MKPISAYMGVNLYPFRGTFIPCLGVWSTPNGYGGTPSLYRDLPFRDYVFFLKRL